LSAIRPAKFFRLHGPNRKSKELEMLTSNPRSRNESYRQFRRGRSFEAIYQAQRPAAVSRNDWSTVFDAFVVEWAYSLASESLGRLALPRSERPA
jgi:hypothetical protein